LQLNLFFQNEVIDQPKSQFVITIKDNNTLPFYGSLVFAVKCPKILWS
jgi:hypothetical protein